MRLARNASVLTATKLLIFMIIDNASFWLGLSFVCGLFDKWMLREIRFIDAICRYCVQLVIRPHTRWKFVQVNQERAVDLSQNLLGVEKREKGAFTLGQRISLTRFHTQDTGKQYTACHAVSVKIDIFYLSHARGAMMQTRKCELVENLFSSCS